MSNSKSGYGKFTGQPLIPSVDGINGNHDTQKLPLGTIIKDVVGNSFKYIKANEALSRGDVVTNVVRAAWDSTTVVDGAIVANTTKILHVDTNTSAWTANQYAGYSVSQATASGKGAAYEIEKHAAVAASGEVDIYLTDSMEEAFADGAVLYIHHPFLVELTDAATEVIMGVACDDITSGYFGWVQVGGFCPMVTAGHSTSAAIVLNEPLVPVAGNPGAVQGMAGATEPDIMEAAASPLIALRAVGANTTGYVEAFIKGLV